MGHRRICVLAVALAAVVGACGSGDDDDDAAVSGADTTAAAVDDESITDAGGTTAGGGSTDDPGSTDPGSNSDPASTDPGAVETTAPASTAPPTTIPSVPEVGDAVTIESAVDLRPVEEVDFSPLAEATPVAVGDVLKTDSSGYAEIAYFDGSRTRLDVNTEFEVLELVDDAGRSTARTRMGLGRTWHRVESLGEGEGGFSVETSVATATVRGTAFSIGCDSEQACNFTVVEGSIEVELLDGTVVQLEAPSSLDVTDEGAAEPVTVPYEAVFGDEWLLDNGNRDRDAGFPGPVQIYRTFGPGMASLSGTYVSSATVVANDCGGCVFQEPTPLGPSGSGGVTIDVDCTSGFPCTGDREGTPVTYDGTSMSYTRPLENQTACNWDDDGDGEFDDRQTGQLRSEVRIRLRPTRASVRKGVWSVVEMRGKSRVIYTVVDTGGCEQLFVGEQETVISDVVWKR